MNTDDLSRRFSLDVTPDGALFIRKRGEKIHTGALPVFSVDTYDDADSLRTLHCRLARDGSGVYRLNTPPETLTGLYAWTDKLRASYDAMLARRKLA